MHVLRISKRCHLNAHKSLYTSYALCIEIQTTTVNSKFKHIELTEQKTKFIERLFFTPNERNRCIKKTINTNKRKKKLKK